MIYKMKIKYILFQVVILIFSTSAGAQKDSVTARIISLGKSDNRVMEHMDFLSNRFGDRLTGSDNYYSACVWAVNTMRSWGMMAEMQEVGEMPVGFNRGPWFGKMITPEEMTLDFGTPAYTAGTKGRQKGHVFHYAKERRGFLERQRQHQKRLDIDRWRKQRLAS